MKLYMHPVSTVSRPVRLFIAEHSIPVEEQVVDLMTGEHIQEAYSKLNPNRLVPLLQDGDLTLSESSAILKYLADKVESPAYPKDLKKRAKVNEAMDWFNSNFYKDFGYGLVYPQLFPHHRRPEEAQQQATLQWGSDKARGWLQILDDHLLGPEKPYLCGNEITIADYFGACIVTAGEIVGCKFADYPNVQRWLGNMKKLEHWDSVNEVMYGFAASLEGKQFVNV